MWKIVIIPLCLLLSLRSQAQDKPSTDPNAVGPYEGIIRDSLSQGELYKRSKQWILATFKSYDSNVSLNDAGQEMLATTPVVTLERRNLFMLFTATNQCTFKLTILVRPNRIKYSFNNFTHQYQLTTGRVTEPLYDGPFTNSKVYKRKIDKMKPELDGIIAGYVASLNKAIHTNTDW